MEESIYRILAENGGQIILTFLIKGAFSDIKRTIKGYKDVELILNDQDFEDKVIVEVKKTFTWASIDLFKNHLDNDNIYKRYVHLDLYLAPRRQHFSRNEIENKKPIKEVILADKSNLAILGQPGSGKTTSMKYIFHSILLDPSFMDGVYVYPLIIRLRELNKSNSYLGEDQHGGIFEKLAEIFGLKTNLEKVPKSEQSKIRKQLIRELIPSILDNLKVLLILDGFDEIGNSSLRDLVVQEIKELTKSLNYVNFIITSRSADFPFQIENIEKLEISEIDDDQLKDFSLKFFENENISDKFLEELYLKTPYKDFYRRPLLLTHIASIYSKSKEIPEKPKLIYQTIINLILKEWDEMQDVKRGSNYSKFSVDRKREFLSSLAFNLKLRYNKSYFSRDEIALVYSSICSKFDLPPDNFDNVIDEVESHNGILIKSGYNSYEFSHLTIQEYLVADYLVRGGSIRLEINELLLLPNELAIAISLSSEPNILLFEILVEKILSKSFNLGFILTFFNRISLEKPDFAEEAILGIALLYTYSKFVNIERDPNSDSKTRYENLEGRKRFEEFILNGDFLEVIKKVQEYYTIDNEKLSSNLGEYIGLRKKKNISDDLLRMRLPKYIISNPKFISAFN